MQLNWFEKLAEVAKNDSFVKLIFDHLRNIGLIGVIFAASIWKGKHIGDG